MRVKIDSAISLSELAQLTKQGVSVMKTPHVGNFYPNNLAIAKAGIPMVIYDRNLGQKDTNFHPDHIIINGIGHRIAQDHLLMTHARLEEDPPYDLGGIKKGNPVAAFHLSALQKALPQAQLTPYSDYLNQRKDLALKILQQVSQIKTLSEDFIWQRVVDSKGQIIKVIPTNNWSEINRLGIYNLTNHQSGYLIPNFINIFLVAMMEAIISQKNTVYSLSGPDMICYIKKMIPELEDLFQKLQINNPLWPEAFDLRIVPASEMRLAVRSDKQEDLDRAFKTYQTWLNFKEMKASQMRQSKNSEAKSALAKSLEKQGLNLRLKIKEALIQCPDIFYDIQQGNFLSQHDLAVNGHHLYVHPRGLDLPLKEIQTMMSTFRKILKA